MRRFFIFSAIALLASCQKEANPVTHTPPEMMETNAAKTFIPGGPISSGNFKLTFTSVSPAPSSLPPTLEFTCLSGCWPNATYQFNDSINATEFLGQDGLQHITIEVHKDTSTFLISSTFLIYIIGDSTQ